MLFHHDLVFSIEDGRTFGKYFFDDKFGCINFEDTEKEGNIKVPNFVV